MDNERESRGLPTAGTSVLRRIFTEDELNRMERFNRIARCKALAQDMRPSGEDPQFNESLALLRQLLRAEYRAALSAYIQGELKVAAARVAPATASPQAAPHGWTTMLKGVLPWTR